jgi:hypothetical protein
VAYAADFYIPDNIIGYTGVLSKNPTVYFLSATLYGHITQVHDVWENVGREEIRSNASYEFGNMKDTRSLVERDAANNMVHESRSPIILVGAGALPPELTHAIMVHSEQKALRLGQEPEVTSQNVARGLHPGQQPTDAERGAAGLLILFHWTRQKSIGVPSDTRLHAISQRIG